MTDSSTMAASGATVQRRFSVGGSEDSHDDPLLGCLVLITKLHHRPFSEDSLRAGLPLVHNRLTPGLFHRAASRAGMSSKVVRRSLDQISDLVLPCVLLLKNEQSCVLVRIDHER